MKVVRKNNYIKFLRKHCARIGVNFLCAYYDDDNNDMIDCYYSDCNNNDGVFSLKTSDIV